MNTRMLNLNLEILRTLDQCQGYLLPEPALVNHLRLALAPPPLTAETRAALNGLEARRLVVGVQPELGGPRKWRLTEEGKAELLANTI
ncbi:MAG: hypothetical protein AB1705_26750 [Verrucomicrobiota bacterium]